MKKIILIIFMAMISSFSYYGAVNENGEKVTNFENTIQDQENVVQEKVSNREEIQTENVEMQKQEEKKEEQQEIAKQETTQISDNKSKTQSTESRTQAKNEVKNDTKKQASTPKNKTHNIQTTTSKEKKQTENIKKEQTPVTSQSNSNYTEKEVKVAPKTECVGNNHKISAGNTGKWFETKAQADSYYNTEIEKWGKKWESGEIDKTKYLKECPSGYEVWTCPQCQKWTINFYYR